ncbi:hypothetical protein [Ramlibacter alkalitolerans]|uniref:Uncharacterized protein n=1 Tax=Ramlibacter alkalitolerans TaxID=2039631 RepID=A0ABS1JVN5_9BURK|nr:hypothetical protein [Ramlibacter alkalitolerans]MBL0428186.1 hypothetical protein [Ramlibacter alkalitolerans]
MARQRETREKTSSAGAESWSSRLPVPEAQEGGDSAWELWHEASLRLDLAFAPTEPSDLAELRTGSGMGEVVVTEARPHLLTAHTLMILARRNNRVCPHPRRWAELYELLGGQHRQDLPAPPLQAWLWPQLSGLQKRLRFREHVEWAERHGCLEQLARFIHRLDEAEWVHMGEA